MKAIKKLTALAVSIIVVAAGTVGIPTQVHAMETELFYKTISYDIALNEETVKRYSREEYMVESSRANAQATREMTEHAFSEEVLSPASVVGNDSRILVTDLTESPYRMVACIRGKYTCSAGETHHYKATGFMIGPNTVATAGHVVYIHQDIAEDPLQIHNFM